MTLEGGSFARARNLFQAGRTADTKALLERVVDTHPEDLACRYALAVCLNEEKAWQQAEIHEPHRYLRECESPGSQAPGGNLALLPEDPELLTALSTERLIPAPDMALGVYAAAAWATAFLASWMSRFDFYERRLDVGHSKSIAWSARTTSPSPCQLSGIPRRSTAFTRNCREPVVRERRAMKKILF